MRNLEKVIFVYLLAIVLSQKNIQTNLWYSVAFFSKLLNVHERNYEIHDKKLLEVIWGLEEYRHYFEEISTQN